MIMRSKLFGSMAKSVVAIISVSYTHLVWEDASNKESYGARRKFLLGEELDSVMKYVFRNAILDFCRGADAKYVMNQIMSVIENYPRPVLRVLTVSYTHL